MTVKCPICGKEFDNPQQLGGHLRTHKPKKHSKHSSETLAEHSPEPSVAVASQTASVEVQAKTLAETPPQPPSSTLAQTPSETEARMEQIVRKGANASDSDLAWLNSQLEKPVTKEELEIAKQKLESQAKQMEELARQQQEMLRVPPPPPPAYYTPPRESVTDKITNSIDWNSLANNAMSLLAEIVRERRMARSQPSLAEQIGQLAISNFAATLSKEGGRIMGRKLDINTGEEEEYVTKPVLEVMLKRMAEEIEKEAKQREDLAARWEALEKQIEETRKTISKPVEEKAEEQTPEQPQQEEEINPTQEHIEQLKKAAEEAPKENEENAQNEASA